MDDGSPNPLSDRRDLGLLVGLKGVPTSDSGLPSREEIEGWWVDGMNKGAKWHGNKGGNKDDWKTPIQGMG